MNKFFLEFTQAIKEIGIYESISALLIIALHLYIKNLYDKNISDKQDQIDRLALENREYREKFIKFLDNKLFKEVV